MSTPRLQALVAVFGRHGNLTFGGGNATTATLHREVVERRAWIAQPAFDLAYALSRLTPGTNVLAFITAVGWMLRGWSGAIATLLAGSLPSTALAILVTAFYERWSHNHYAQIALRGAVAAAVAVMITSGLTLVRPAWRDTSKLRILILVAGSFALSVCFSVPPVRVLLFAAIAGWIWPAPPSKA